MFDIQILAQTYTHVTYIEQYMKSFIAKRVKRHF